MKIDFVVHCIGCGKDVADPSKPCPTCGHARDMVDAPAPHLGAHIGPAPTSEELGITLPKF